MFKERLAHVAQYSALPMKKNGDVEDKKCCGLMATRWNEVERTRKRFEWWSAGERNWIARIQVLYSGLGEDGAILSCGREIGWLKGVWLKLKLDSNRQHDSLLHIYDHPPNMYSFYFWYNC